MNAVVGVSPSPTRPDVRGLTVLYDPDCAVCRASKQWMLLRRPVIDVRFVAVNSALARQRFPELELAECAREITVVTDTGHVYRGERAFIMCLWSLRSTRGLALQMARGRKAPVLKAMVGATAWFRALMHSSGCDAACQTRWS